MPGIRLWSGKSAVWYDMTRDRHSTALRVLQLTDPHLMADPAGVLLGVNTRDSLDAVIASAHADGLSPDLILATGDLAQDGSEQAYRVFQDKIRGFNCPSLWLAGNHDNPVNLAKVIAGTDASKRHRVLGGWQFIQLNSAVPGQVHGELDDDELVHLETELSRHPACPAVVTLHHHPIAIGSAWMESIGLRNRDAFWQVIDRFEQVKVVLWGHVHQELDCERQGVRLLATPSTCIQFTPGSPDFSVEPRAPGYRWLTLHDNGDVETAVSRAVDFRYELDTTSSGY